MNCDKWFYTVLALIGLFFVWSLIIFRYYLKANKKGVELGLADKQHEQQHRQNEARIKELEKKNSQDGKEIERLNGKIATLEGIIKKFIGNKSK